MAATSCTPPPPETTPPPSSSSTTTNATQKKKNLFYTTSDLMKTMNNVIQQECGPDARVELQRRLPDGSTKLADDSDLALANLQSKLQQAAKQASHLSPTERLQWAKQQREEGNKLFHQIEYREAMDVYLTCLVGMSTKDDDNVDVQQQQQELQLPVLLNLSLCALKLGMYKRAIQFCNHALELEMGKHSAKVYFRRGKATMLTGGDYNKAKKDLEMALELLKEENDEKEMEVVKNELEKLEYLKRKAQENEEKCKKAMKMVLGGDESLGAEKSSSSGGEKGLYSDIVQKRRTHSNLRASPRRRTGGNLKKKNQRKEEEEESWIHLILSMMTRCLRGTVRMLPWKEEHDKQI